MGNLDWKKIGIIGLFVGAVALFGFLLYYFFISPLFFPSATTNISGNGQTNATGTLPTTVTINGRIYNVDPATGLPTGEVDAGTPTITTKTEPTDRAEGGLTKTATIVSGQALYPTGSADSSLIYYNPTDGRFYQANSAGKISAYSDKTFHNVSNVTWSADNNQAVIEYPDGSNIVYDFSTGKQTTLPQHWQDFSFSATGQLAFKSMALDVENRFLAIANADGSQVKVIESIGGSENQFDVNWSPNSQMVATFTEGKDGDRSNVYFIGQNNENYKLMVVEGRDFRSEWSPDGETIVYSVYSAANNYKPQLWISDAGASTVGNNRHSLNLETWADKCAFSSATKLYCAVPETLSYGAGLQPESAADTPDQIYEIDLATGVKKLLAIPEGDHTISQIIVNENSNYLLFTDSGSNQVYKINL